MNSQREERREVPVDSRALGHYSRLPFAVVVACGVVVAGGVELGLIPGSYQFAGAQAPAVFGVVVPGWCLFYAALSGIYRRVTKRSSAPGVDWRLSGAAAITTVCCLLPNTSGTYSLFLLHAPYLSQLYFLACVFAPLSALLEPETLRLARRFVRSSIGRRVGPWIWPALASGVAVILGETCAWGVNFALSGYSLALNSLILAGVMWLGFSLTRRLVFSTALGLALYVVFVVCHLLKMRFLQSPLLPLDVIALHDLLVLNVFGTAAAARAVAALGALALGLGTLLFIEPGFTGAGVRVRVAAATIATLLLAGLSASEQIPFTSAVLARAGVTWPFWFPPVRARRNGLLLDFALGVGDLRVAEPPDYSQSRIATIRERYGAAPKPFVADGAPGKINLIVYLIEAFSDPADLQIPFTSDPIPNFHALAREHPSGSAISPVFGGASVNAEFELLTGLATHFFPAGSSPYNQYVRTEIPSLARFLRERGYHTAALHVDRLQAFNYYAVYPRLGFDRAISLFDDPGVPQDVAGRRPSDDALVDAIIVESQRGSPFFVFGFPDSTHSLGTIRVTWIPILISPHRCFHPRLVPR